MENGKSLTVADVERLITNPSTQARAETASKVALHYGKSDISPRERNLALEIVRAMARDAEIRVRAALSESLKDNPELPNNIARALAEDASAVAQPMLRFSPRLTDEDLLAIIRSQSAEHQIAIAERDHVSENVSEALVDTLNAQVVTTLMENEGAAINDRSYEKVAEHLIDHESVTAAMTRRSRLPITVAEKLVSQVSEELQHYILTHHEISPETAADLVMASRENATVLLAADMATGREVEELIEELHSNGRLTDTLIVRSACMGDLTFFETALARRANIPSANAYQLVRDRGEQGLRRLLEQAGVSSQYFAICSKAVRLAEDAVTDAGDNAVRLRAQIVSRLLTILPDGELDTDNLDYLLGKISREATA